MKRESILILLILLLVCLAVYSGYQLFAEWQEYTAGEQFYDDLSQLVQMDTTKVTIPTEEATVPPTEATEPTEKEINTTPTEIEAPALEETTEPETTEPETTELTETEEEPIVWPGVDFESLQEINSDVVAWIYIPGTNINYPVVCGSDNDYYLYRLIDGSYNKAGSIFMDYRNDENLSDDNTVLYGHNMQNKSMFAHITKYTDQSFYDKHPRGMLMTPDGNYWVEFFSGYVTDVYDSSWDLRFSSDSKFSAWLRQIATRSYFSAMVFPTAGDRILTLSTCTFDYDNARFVLHGVLRPM